MKWYKAYYKDDMNLAQDMLDLHGFKGYYFLKHLTLIMTEHFDVFNPGCNKFSLRWFNSQFRLDPRTIQKYLDFMQDRQEVFYYSENAYIILYYPELQNRADKYTLKAFVKIANNEELDENLRPNAFKLFEYCERLAESVRSKCEKDD